MTQRILVTGAAGFVGGHLCEALARRPSPPEIVRLTSISDPAAGHLAVDLLDPIAVDGIVSTSKPDVIVHLAAQSSTSRSATDGSGAWAVNVSGTLNLAAAVTRHSPAATFLFASSSEVYGASFLQGPVREASAVLPMTAYARSKHAAETVLDGMLPASCRLLVLRPFNHSGPGQQETFVLPSFAAQIARIEAGLQPPELRVGNIDVVRDFMDVRDVVHAYLALIERAPVLPHRVLLNVASETVHSLRDLIGVLSNLSRAAFDVVVDPTRARPVDVPVARGEAGAAARNDRLAGQGSSGTPARVYARRCSPPACRDKLRRPGAWSGDGRSALV